MKMEKINVITAIIAGHLNLSPAAIDPHRPLSEAGVDSLEMLEIITLVEDEFDVRFDDEVLESINTVADMAGAVQLMLAERGCQV